MSNKPSLTFKDVEEIISNIPEDIEAKENVDEINLEQKEELPESDPNAENIISESDGAETEALTEPKKKKKKKKGKDEEMEKLLNKKMKFKKIDFEHALTDEEKEAKKNAKNKNKKKPKTKKRKSNLKEEIIIPEAELVPAAPKLEEDEDDFLLHFDEPKPKRIRRKSKSAEKPKRRKSKGKKKSVERSTIDDAEVDTDAEMEEIEYEEQAPRKKKRTRSKGKRSVSTKRKSLKKKGKKGKKAKKSVVSEDRSETQSEIEGTPSKEKTKRKVRKSTSRKSSRRSTRQSYGSRKYQMDQFKFSIIDGGSDTDSMSDDDEEEELQSVKGGRKKGKKKDDKRKKGFIVKKAKVKKGAKKESKEIVEKIKEIIKVDEPEEVDILAEIARLKLISEGIVPEEVLSIKPPEPETPKKKKKKKGPKKKLTKKDKAKITAELNEKQRLEAEAEEQRALQEAKLQREKERREAIEKERREIAEHQIRQEQLQKSCGFIDELEMNHLANVRKDKEDHDWDLYVNFGNLPNPAKCDAMNTYLHLWEATMMEQLKIEDVSKRTEDVIKLLADLDDLIDTASAKDTQSVENWIWIQHLFRSHQKSSLDIVTYNLLRKIRDNLHRIDIPTADYNYKDDFLSLFLWLRIQLPIPLPNPRRPAFPRIEISFTNMNMTVLFPTTIDCNCMAIRAMYLNYDHFSDLCALYKDANMDSGVQQNLLANTNAEFRGQLQYKFDSRTKNMKTELVNPIPNDEEQTDLDEVETREVEVFQNMGYFEDIRLVPYEKLRPSASEFMLNEEDVLYAEQQRNLSKSLPDHVINLRKFSILGGVYFLNLLKQPPQPQEFVTIMMNITPLYLPKQLEEVPFYVLYTPPEPPEPGVRRLPEEIEEEMKKQEEEMDKLMLISLTWSQNVIFLELPIVCHWDEAEQVWTKKDVHDLKHNEEKGMLTFRTGRFGTFALATYRYANLPYQAWDLKPELDDTVTLQITTAILMLEFNVKEGLICIAQLQNSPNMVLQDKIGIYMQLHKLKRLMQQAGIDIFPAVDAFCYVEVGTCEKQWPMEKHLYFNMATISNSFNFVWSRWNVTAGRRSIVMQMREYSPDKAKQKNHQMCLVTPLKAAFIECTEVSQNFSDADIPNSKFSADLSHLIKGHCGIAIRKKIKTASKENVHALAQLLISTRVLSFS